MSPTSHALSPDALRRHHSTGRAWSEVLHLPFRQKRWRGQSGDFSGTGVGSSLRVPGPPALPPGRRPPPDQLAGVRPDGELHDEAVTARRSGRLSTWCSMPRIRCSPSRPRPCARSRPSTTPSRPAGASVPRSGCSPSKGGVIRPLPEEAVMNDRWAAELDGITDTAPNEPPALSQLPFRAGAMRISLSDLLFPGPPEAVVQPLVARGGRGIVFAPAARQESDPHWDGNYEFVDSESTLHHLRRNRTDPPPPLRGGLPPAFLALESLRPEVRARAGAPRLPPATSAPPCGRKPSLQGRSV